MGLTISGNYKNSIDLTGGYGMFIKIREKVALAFNKQFGEHYLTLKQCFRETDFKTFNVLAEDIIEKNELEKDSDILDFLFASDCSGKINYKTCKKIYELIKNIKDEKLVLRYAAYSENDWEDFKELLKECYSHRSKLVWY